MYDAPGERVEKAAVRVIQHGKPAVIGNEVGFVAKVTDPGRYVNPSSSDYTEIAVGEIVTFFIRGVHELKLEGAIAAAPVGEKLWIDPDNDTVRLHSAKTAGDLPLGVIDDIDAARTPDVAHVNLDSWHAFLPSA